MTAGSGPVSSPNTPIYLAGALGLLLMGGRAARWAWVELGPVLTVTLAVLALAAVVYALSRFPLASRNRGRTGQGASVWATSSDRRPLVRNTGWTLGRAHRWSRVLRADEEHNAIVLAASGLGRKTTGVVIPNALAHDGPLVVLSAKADVAHVVTAHRSTLGPTYVFDPTGQTGRPSARWNPLREAGTWQGALRVADAMTNNAAKGKHSTKSEDYFDDRAAELLAPLLYAAANSGRTMGDVSMWSSREGKGRGEGGGFVSREATQRLPAYTSEPWDLLDGLPDEVTARTWLDGVDSVEGRQRDSIVGTVRTLIRAYEDPGVLDSSLDHGAVDVRHVLDHRGTILLVAPPAEQRRLSAVFLGLLGEIRRHADARAAEAERLDPGRPVRIPRVRFILDEAANIAPVRDLPTWASVCRGSAQNLLLVYQDLAQLQAVYDEDAPTIIGNCQAKLVAAGIQDPATMRYLSDVLGKLRDTDRSRTLGSGRYTHTTSVRERQALDPIDVSRIKPGRALLLYPPLPLVRLQLRVWHRDRQLRALVDRATDVQPPTEPPDSSDPAPHAPTPVAVPAPRPDEDLAAQALAHALSTAPPPTAPDPTPTPEGPVPDASRAGTERARGASGLCLCGHRAEPGGSSPGHRGAQHRGACGEEGCGCQRFRRPRTGSLPRPAALPRVVPGATLAASPRSAALAGAVRVGSGPRSPFYDPEEDRFVSADGEVITDPDRVEELREALVRHQDDGELVITTPYTERHADQATQLLRGAMLDALAAGNVERVGVARPDGSYLPDAPVFHNGRFWTLDGGTWTVVTDEAQVAALTEAAGRLRVARAGDEERVVDGDGRELDPETGTVGAR